MTMHINNKLTEDEYAALIRMATNENVVCCTFGPSGVRLEIRVENNWAFKALERMRTPRPPFYNEETDTNSCPMCGKVLYQRYRYGNVIQQGQRVEMDVSWLECTGCGYVWNK